MSWRLGIHFSHELNPQRLTMSITRANRCYPIIRLARFRLLSCLAGAVLFVLPASVRADCYWSVTSGDWSVPSNWDVGAMPTSNDDAYIANGGTVNITTTDPLCNNLWLGEDTGSGTLQMTAGSLSTWAQYIGDSGVGNFMQSGGTNGGATYLYLGNNSGMSGTYSLSGSGLLSILDTEYVGESGTGYFTQSGGTNHVSRKLYLGDNHGSSGIYNLSGSGLLSASTQYIGYGGIGTFTQSGGTNSVSGILYLGQYAGGTYNLGGSGLLSVTGTENVGSSGTFTQTSGTDTAAFLSIVKGGCYQLNGGTLQVTAASATTAHSTAATSPAH